MLAELPARLMLMADWLSSSRSAAWDTLRVRCSSPMTAKKFEDRCLSEAPCPFWSHRIIACNPEFCLVL